MQARARTAVARRCRHRVTRYDSHRRTMAQQRQVSRSSTISSGLSGHDLSSFLFESLENEKGDRNEYGYKSGSRRDQAFPLGVARLLFFRPL